MSTSQHPKNSHYYPRGPDFSFEQDNVFMKSYISTRSMAEEQQIMDQRRKNVKFLELETSNYQPSSRQSQHRRDYSSVDYKGPFEERRRSTAAPIRYLVMPPTTTVTRRQVYSTRKPSEIFNTADNNFYGYHSSKKHPPSLKATNMNILRSTIGGAGYREAGQATRTTYKISGSGYDSFFDNRNSSMPGHQNSDSHIVDSSKDVKEKLKSVIGKDYDPSRRRLNYFQLNVTSPPKVVKNAFEEKRPRISNSIHITSREDVSLGKITIEGEEPKRINPIICTARNDDSLRLKKEISSSKVKERLDRLKIREKYLKKNSKKKRKLKKNAFQYSFADIDSKRDKNLTQMILSNVQYPFKKEKKVKFSQENLIQETSTIDELKQNNTLINFSQRLVLVSMENKRLHRQNSEILCELKAEKSLIFSLQNRLAEANNETREANENYHRENRKYVDLLKLHAIDKERIQHLKIELEKFENNINKNRNAENKLLEENIQLNNVIFNLKDQVKAFESPCMNQNSGKKIRKMSSLQQSLNDSMLTVEKNDLQQEIDQIKKKLLKEIDDKRTMRSSMAKDYDDLSEKNHNLTLEISKLERKVSELRNTTISTSSKLEDMEDLRALVKKLREEIQELKKDKIKLERNYDELLGESKSLAKGWMVKLETTQEENLGLASLNQHLAENNSKLSGENFMYATRLVLAYAELERSIKFSK